MTIVALARQMKKSRPLKYCIAMVFVETKYLYLFHKPSPPTGSRNFIKTWDEM
jgi:hypothetical protein